MEAGNFREATRRERERGKHGAAPGRQMKRDPSSRSDSELARHGGLVAGRAE